MVSTVLSGSGNVSYTNNTGQIVRVIINSILSSVGQLSIGWGNPSNPAQATGSFVIALGKYISHNNSGKDYTNSISGITYHTSVIGDGMVINPLDGIDITFSGGVSADDGPPTTHQYSLPTEIYLNPGDTLSISGKGYLEPDETIPGSEWNRIVNENSSSTISGYNIVIIPENG